ncbi:MAG: DCC1-like thiol-disulfide oxidoreductase family protein [bacterium]|nr:DCC1-like thiol-disulfide oxidoreductase family protein [bacterium]
MDLDKVKSNQKQTVYYDGGCPMCTVLMEKVTNSDQSTAFDFNNVENDSLPESIKKEEAEKEIHVVDEYGKIYKNSDAIFQIFSQYPNLKFLSKLGRLPIIGDISQLIYKFVARNRYFIFGKAARVFWLKVIVVFGLISGLLLSTRLWLGVRIFPHIPVISDIFKVSANTEIILFITLISTLLYIVFSSKPKKAIFLAIAVCLFFAFFDQMRWQPWFFQYVFMLSLLGAFSWNHKDSLGIERVLNANRLIVASVYFFSGLQKLNLTFTDEIFPWMVKPIVNLLPSVLELHIHQLGTLVPFIEIAIGIGLLTNRFRKSAVILAMMSILFILATLGPFGNNWNSVVWPWNIVMLIIVPLLFWNIPNFSVKDIFWPKNNFFQKVVVLFFVISPIFSFFNLWDSYLSFALYSGNVNSARIYVSDRFKERSPDELNIHLTAVEPNIHELNLFMWSINELNVPIYPETRIFKGVAKEICKYAYTRQDLVLEIKGKPTIFNADNLTYYNCSNL